MWLFATTATFLQLLQVVAYSHWSKHRPGGFRGARPWESACGGLPKAMLSVLLPDVVPTTARTPGAAGYRTGELQDAMLCARLATSWGRRGSRARSP